VNRLSHGIRRALWALAVLAAAGALLAAALRVARSMRRGRGAAFSLTDRESRLPEKGDDLLAAWASARYEGPGADEAWEALASRAAASPRREVPGDRRVVVSLPEDGRRTARRALHLAAGGAAEFRLTVPASATLSFVSAALSAEAGTLEAPTELLLPNEPPRVLDPGRVVFKAGGPSESPWRRVEIDLSPWAGRTVALRWRASLPGAGKAAHAFWASPRLWTPDARPAPGRPPKARGPQNVLWVVFESFPVPASQAPPEDFQGLGFLAREGVEFQQVYTNRTDGEGGLRRLLTGRLMDAPAGPREKAGPQGLALPAALRKAGYRTALLGAPAGEPADWAALGFDQVQAAPSAGSGGERVLRDAALWLSREGGRTPTFLLVFVRAPAPQEDPSPRCWLRAARLSPGVLFRGRRWRALAQAVQMDGALARLWTQVIRLGQDGNALLGVCSLRGPSFRPEPLRRLDDGRLFRRPLPEPGWGLREEEVRVLWLMRHPRLGFGRLVTSPAQLLDAAPTVLELAGLPPEPGMDGLSFIEKGARAARADQGARFVLQGAGGDALVLDGHYKYVRRAPARRVHAGRPALTDFEPEELYDLWAAPGETRNLARRRRDLLARARRAVNEHLPRRTAVRLLFQGYADAPLQGVARCPGGDLWNVSLSSGDLRRSGSNEVSFVPAGPDPSFSFETWPPPASYSLLLRARAGVPADAFLVSRLGLPLVEAEKRTEWYDGNKFPWMDGFPDFLPPGDKPRVYMGRVEIPEPAP
jgi:hypothetical protein